MLGVVHTGIAYIFYFGSIDTLPVSKVAILGYIEPVLSIVTGVVFFKEEMSDNLNQEIEIISSIDEAI